MKKALMLATAVLALAPLPRALSANGRVLTIDDFEDGDRRAASGLSWMAIADDLMGGASYADLQVTQTDGRRALKVEGKVTAEGFAGAWTAFDGQGRATDLGDFAGIRLRVRGSGTLQVALRAGPGGGFNYARPVEARPQWTSEDVPFESLQPMAPDSPRFDRGQVRWLGVSVKAVAQGPYEFAIDDVQLYATRPGARLRVQDGPAMAQAFEAAPASDLPRGPWTDLAKDASGDGTQKRLPDATALAVSRDDARGLLWFRLALAEPIPPRWLGVNLALDTDGDPANGMAWWGTNTAFHFDRLVTVYGSVTDTGYQGMFGIADAAEVQAGAMSGSTGERVTLILDRAGPALVVGIPRSALGTASSSVRLVAAVGSAFRHNDDVPNEGAATLVR